MENKVVSFTPRESVKRTASFRRENSFWKELALIDLDTGANVANIRFYGAGATVYCVAWFSLWRYGVPEAGETGSCRGCGKAGGGGYHKPSAAMVDALNDAGFEFSQGISGRGDSAMYEALHAIAAHVGIKRPLVHVAHA